MIARIHPLLAAFALLAQQAQGQVPQHLNYQGRVSVNGVNFTGNGQFKFALVDGGTTFGTTAAATATVDENGVVTGVFVDNTGTNYTEPPTITFGGPGTGATATAHLDLGIVSYVTVTNGGSGYTTAPTVTFSAPPTLVVHNHVWNNDGSQNGDAPPTAAVTLPVVNGLYSVALGDPAQGMVPFNQGIFSIPLFLRVWFNDGVHDFQQLTPDQALATAPYAARSKLSEAVTDGSIGNAALAAGAVGTANLADGAVSVAKLADGSVDASKLADGSVDPSKLAPATVPGIVQNVLDSPTITSLNGGVVLSPDPDSSRLASDGYVKIGSQSFSTESWAGLGFSPPPVPVALEHPQALWTGTEMLVFGDRVMPTGFFPPAPSTQTFIHAYKFNPDTTTWTDMGRIEGSMEGAKMVQAGADVLFWGIHRFTDFLSGDPNGWEKIGGFHGGARYRLAQGTWENLNSANQPSLRKGFSAVWTGSRLIVWGGLSTLSKGFGLNSSSGLRAETIGGIYNPIANIWTSFSGGPVGRIEHSATWMAIEMVVWGGVEWIPTGDPIFGDGNFVARNTGAAYNPETNVWRDISTSGAPSARYGHTAVASGSFIHVFGGSSSGGGATYNWFTNEWFTMPDTGSPQGKFHPAVTLMGSKIFVWGGASSSSVQEGVFGSLPGISFSAPVNTGAVYDSNTNAWTAISSPGAPVAQLEPTCIWTGSQVILYGGQGGLAGTWLGNASAWNGTSNTWSALDGQLVPRRLAKTVWTGSELLYWGGENSSGQMRSGGRFNLTANTHDVLPLHNAPSARTGHSAVWTGTEMLVWGGQNQAGGSYPTDSAKYRRSTNGWTPISTTDAPSARKDHTAVWTGTEMIIWGGVGAGGDYPSTGGRYNPTADQWQALSQSGSPPAARADHTATWTGTKMIIWGGRDGSGPVGTGAVYTPSTGEWTPLPTDGAPSPRYLHSATWTGTDIIIWGGIDASNNSPTTGARYSTTNNTWHPISTLNAPAARAYHSAVWSGSELIIWGGRSGSAGTVFGDGARYSLALENWQPLTGTGAPSARWGQTSLWAGTGLVTLFGQATNGTHPADAFRYTPPATVYYYLKLNP